MSGSSFRSNNPLKAVIVGAGLMGRFHAIAIRQCRHAIAAVVDPDTTRAKRLAASFGISDSCSTLEEALERTPADIVHICTPASTHAAIARVAIHHGMHLVIEKPLACSSHETDLLLRLAEQNSSLICPVHQFLFQNGIREALENIERVGRIVLIESVFFSAGSTALPRERWDSVCADILPHPLSLLQRFLPGGIPLSGWAKIQPAPGEWRVSGVSGTISLSILISMSARPTRATFTVRGTHGSFHVDLFHGFSYFEHGRVSRRSKMVQPFSNGSGLLLAAAANLANRLLHREFAYPGLNRLVAEFYRAAAASGARSPIRSAEVSAVAHVRDLLVSAPPLTVVEMDTSKVRNLIPTL